MLISDTINSELTTAPQLLKLQKRRGMTFQKTFDKHSKT